MIRPAFLRAVRQHPIARLCVLWALIAYSAVGLAPLPVPTIDRAELEICTAEGLRSIPVGYPSPGRASDRDKTAKHCAFCALHSTIPLPPAGSPLALPDRSSPTHAVAPHGFAITDLFAGFDHSSRAPPGFS